MCRPGTHRGDLTKKIKIKYMVGIVKNMNRVEAIKQN